MTGEITLRGNVLPIGGLKEKILAARRAGITTIVCPKLNKKELDEVPAAAAARDGVPPGGRRGRGAEAGPHPAAEVAAAARPAPKAPPKPFPAKPRSKPVIV